MHAKIQRNSQDQIKRPKVVIAIACSVLVSIKVKLVIVDCDVCQDGYSMQN